MTFSRRGWTMSYVALAAADTWLSGSAASAHRWRNVTKPSLMPSLSASLVTALGTHSSPLRKSTLVAQGFGWAGDVALLRNGDTAFLVGAGSFAVGHLAYITGFHRLRRPWTGLGDEKAPILVAALWAVSAPVVATAAAARQPSLGVAVATYSALLATTLVSATRLSDDLPPEVRRLAVGGAALFLVSDTILGARLFLLEDPPAFMERLVMASYAVAQLLLSEAATRTG